MLRVFLYFITSFILSACAGSGGEGDVGETNKTDDPFTQENAVFEDEVDRISVDTVMGMVSTGSAPWEVEFQKEKLKERVIFVNWLDRQNIPIKAIGQIASWMEYSLEYTTLTVESVEAGTWLQANQKREAITTYHLGLASEIMSSKRKGEETITSSGDGMLVTDVLDLMHSYYLEYGYWTKAEYDVIESIRSKVDKIERVPGIISINYDLKTLEICQVTTDQFTHEVSGPCSLVKVN